MNKEIITGLKIFRDENTRTVIAKIEFALNVSHKRTIGLSPWEVLEQRSIFDPLKRKLEVDSKEIENRLKKAGEAG